MAPAAFAAKCLEQGNCEEMSIRKRFIGSVEIEPVLCYNENAVCKRATYEVIW